MSYPIHHEVWTMVSRGGINLVRYCIEVKLCAKLNDKVWNHSSELIAETVRGVVRSYIYDVLHNIMTKL